MFPLDFSLAISAESWRIFLMKMHLFCADNSIFSQIMVFPSSDQFNPFLSNYSEGAIFWSCEDGYQRSSKCMEHSYMLLKLSFLNVIHIISILSCLTLLACWVLVNNWLILLLTCYMAVLYPILGGRKGTIAETSLHNHFWISSGLHH